MATVCVACKVPNGVILSGNGKTATLKGSAQVSIHERPGGYALTENVDADLWAEWSQAHADSELIQNSIVFAEENLNVLRARAFSRARVQGFQSPIR